MLLVFIDQVVPWRLSITFLNSTYFQRCFIDMFSHFYSLWINYSVNFGLIVLFSICKFFRQAKCGLIWAYWFCGSVHIMFTNLIPSIEKSVSFTVVPLYHMFWSCLSPTAPIQIICDQTMLFSYLRFLQINWKQLFSKLKVQKVVDRPGDVITANSQTILIILDWLKCKIW